MRREDRKKRRGGRSRKEGDQKPNQRKTNALSVTWKAPINCSFLLFCLPFFAFVYPRFLSLFVAFLFPFSPPSCKGLLSLHSICEPAKRVSTEAMETDMGRDPSDGRGGGRANWSYLTTDLVPQEKQKDKLQNSFHSQKSLQHECPVKPGETGARMQSPRSFARTQTEAWGNGNQAAAFFFPSLFFSASESEPYSRSRALQHGPRPKKPTTPKR